MLKLFFVLSAILLVAMLLTVYCPKLTRLPFLQSLSPKPGTLGVVSPVTSSAQISVLPAHTAFAPYSTLKQLPSLSQFSMALYNGKNGVVGVYAPDLFALPVLQQPKDRADFVSTDDDLVTEFSLPKKYGSTGLLAHNYLSGEQFYKLGLGQEVMLVFGNGLQMTYRIERVEQYQALSPNSPLSDFIDLNTPDRSRLTSSQLFHHIYGMEGALIFQTCIESGSESSWGRMFVIAIPVNIIQSVLPTLAPLSLN